MYVLLLYTAIYLHSELNNVRSDFDGFNKYSLQYNMIYNYIYLHV